MSQFISQGGYPYGKFWYRPTLLCLLFRVCLTACLSSMCLCICVDLSVSVCLAVCLTACLPLHLSMHPCVCLSVCLSVFVCVCLCAIWPHTSPHVPLREVRFSGKWQVDRDIGVFSSTRRAEICSGLYLSLEWSCHLRNPRHQQHDHCVCHCHRHCTQLTSQSRGYITVFFYCQVDSTCCLISRKYGLQWTCWGGNG